MSSFDWGQFNPQEAADAVSGALPAGEYRVMIKQPRWTDTKSGGRMFWLSFEVIDGPLTGQSADIGFNLVNQNDTAVRIARGELGKICLAAGMTSNPSGEHEFVNRTLFLSVKEEDYNGRKTNRFDGARPNGNSGQTSRTASAPTSAPKPTTTPAANGNSSKPAGLPWKK